LSGMQDHGEMKTLVASYVIGAVPPEETARIRSHILTCDECMAEAESLAATTSALALAVSPETVPEGFADRVMARVAEPEAAAETEPRPARRWSLTAILSVAALLVVIAVFAAGWFDARSDLARNERVVDVVLDSRGGINLAGSGDAVGKVVSSEEGGSLFVAQGLEAAPEGHTYQLWLMKGSCADPASASCQVHGSGTFDSDAGISILRTSRPLKGYDRAAVTIEPDGGSATPTTEPVLISA
jgi:anti-sigma-K factor RskA